MRVFVILCVIFFSFVSVCTHKGSKKDVSPQHNIMKLSGPARSSSRYASSVSVLQGKKSSQKPRLRPRRPKKPKRSKRPKRPTDSDEVYLPVPRPPFRTVDLYSAKAPEGAEPHSGEWIRLRGNSTYMNSGLVEVYRRGQWGIVCDDEWDLKDATVACKQLGFKHGAVAAPPNARYGYGNYTEDDVLMDQVTCTGQERHLQECEYDTRHDCKQHEAASVVCKVNKGCQAGWVSGYGSCYKFFGGARNLRDANSKCSELEASLVNIETEEENNFLSNVLSQTARNTVWWYTGGKRTKKLWNWYQTTKLTVVRRGRTINHVRTRKYLIKFQKWFPGWPSSAYNQQPSSQRRHNCLVLTNTYHHPSGTPTKTNYFFWAAFPCLLRGRNLDFICEKQADPEPKECYSGDGSDYRGLMSVTIKGTQCVSWTGSVSVNPRNYPNKGLGDHNYCRNPDDDMKPWCWVSHDDLKFGYCAVPQCSQQAPTTTATITEDPWGPDCPANQFFCHKTTICISSDYRCDGEIDCEYGEDEENCEYEIVKFTKYPNKEVVSIYANATYISITLEMCAKHCLNSRLFVCRALLYALDERECIITDVNIQLSGILQNSTKFDYFELISQAANCTNMFRCRNGKCISLTDVCNSRDDCNDFSDETNCGEPDPLEVRLVGGDEHSGTVEIKYMGEWGIICDDDWDIKDSHVVCRMLGYKYAVTEISLAEFGQGNGNILLSNVGCHGNETSLAECKKPAWRKHVCHAYEAAGVVCAVDKGEAAPLEVRLVGGNTHSGTIEIKYMGQWGIICDDDWDINDSHVVCRMLGYKQAMTAVNQAEFGHGNGNIILSNVRCLGNETSLAECEKPAWFSHVCYASEAAGVICAVDGEAAPLEVRLVGGNTHSGTIEIKYMGQWGIICDDDWDINDSHVVCRMLGYKQAMTAVNQAEFGHGNENIILSNVRCLGNETSLAECEKPAWFSHVCYASEAAGVICAVDATTTTTTSTTTTTPTTTTTTTTTPTTTTTTAPVPPLQVHLVGGSSRSEGRVEITYRGVRGTICDDLWDNQDAAVICNMLGYSGGGVAVVKARFGKGSGPILLDDVECRGTESSIEHCDFLQWGNHNCDHNEDAGVKCYTHPKKPPTTVAPKSIKIELVDGSSSAEGRVEMIVDGIRGTICDDDWDDDDASVVCKMLGFSAGGVAFKKAPFGTGALSSPIWLDDVQCEGSEKSILDCPCSRCVGPLKASPAAWNKSNCNHGEDAGVKCTSPTMSSAYLELVGGSTDREGRVEIVRNEVRGTVCDDDWDDKDATVVCRMLGFRHGGIAKSESYFPGNTESSKIWLSNVNCEGTEDNLGQCELPDWGVHRCSHKEDAGVVCRSEPKRNNTELQCGQRPLWFKNRRKRAAANETLYKIKPAHFSKIIGGQAVEYGLYPWQAGIRKVFRVFRDGTVSTQPLCGATVYNEMWIISAAHCFMSVHKSRLRIMIGDHHHKKREREEQVFEVQHLVRHQRYDRETHDYDIALIKLKPKNGRGIRFSDYVQPACLPSAATSYTTGMECLVSGWGLTKGGRPNILRAAVVPLISQNVCRRLYKNHISSRMMCAGYIEGGIDTCSGDSGGPLVCEIDGLYTLLGVTSWGNGCAKPYSPGVYANVKMFLPWIAQTVHRYS